MNKQEIIERVKELCRKLPLGFEYDKSLFDDIIQSLTEPAEVSDKENIKELIKSIHINKANFDYCSETLKINGTLYSEIERVILEYANAEKTTEYCKKHPKERIFTHKVCPMCEAFNYKD